MNPKCPSCAHARTLLTLSPQFPPDLTYRYICLHCGAEAPKGASELDAYHKAMERVLG